MKRILITGANSYIGTSFEAYLRRWPEEFQVDTVDMIGNAWRETSFSGYDAVFHVAGIAHSDNGKITPEKEQLYYAVNTSLTIQTAQKAKADGVGQFIFMSSAIVYGESSPIGKQKIVTADTPVNPSNCYGDSKVQAERGIMPLRGENFRVVILRPPTIYGPGSKGNYPMLSKLARKLPAFPKVENQRSMLYIENLMEFIRLMVVNEEDGVFWPQNEAYFNTSELVQQIAQAHGKRICLVPGLSWLLKLLSHGTGLVNKAFGSLTYDQALSDYRVNYRVCDSATSICRTEEAVEK